MKVNRLKDIKPYEAGGHFDMKGFRLQGHDASDLENFWVGLSYFLPGGGTTHTSTPLEKCYVCVGGAITIKTDNEEVTLENLDSIYLEPSESRSIINKSNEIATILVIMPYPEKA
ncbi:MAG: cupin domain-containing protein [Rhodospirillaceae bacterium]|jgi:quercetin dioxygenase-like cupin family protein|nr:cupin domain-containing protein [Rhodospirillaceae bacterium]|tara:strand:+ start:914 stop:1258 length:345 start_codon:yes stop_codon:yes gene_type:complete